MSTSYATRQDFNRSVSPLQQLSPAKQGLFGITPMATRLESQLPRLAGAQLNYFCGNSMQTKMQRAKRLTFTLVITIYCATSLIGIFRSANVDVNYKATNELRYRMRNIKSGSSVKNLCFFFLIC